MSIWDLQKVNNIVHTGLRTLVLQYIKYNICEQINHYFIKQHNNFGIFFSHGVYWDYRESIFTIQGLCIPSYIRNREFPETNHTSSRNSQDCYSSIEKRRRVGHTPSNLYCEVVILSCLTIFLRMIMFSFKRLSRLIRIIVVFG